MNTAELKKLAELLDGTGKELMQIPPAAILKLLEINAELVEALNNLLNDTQHSEHFCGDKNCPVASARAALAKAEGEQS